ncbi:type I 3-dehydroquinate dehydratase [Brachyspira murdochii]|uniref:3-dehydroquinate dehydratase n=1 Tax=Brachyspira murdochii (strain ATCC 51284 / DSM 12563 / 56-150) TaxID=526224 RepID=D5U5F0_BRAM5|nr:type I 3-dehydroquinate dehydratase [Brachyspira murdochii]ADG72427.1 3-dehydroquinate dehydratase, type I [Brachyspira murdochii DSM 12563]
MENIVKIKNIKLGIGSPKICIPVVEKNEKDIIKYIKEINKLPVDIIEWRADFFINDTSNFDYIISISNEIKKTTNKPILFTLRSIKEGGNIKYNNSIIDVYNAVIENKCFDLIDLELLTLKDDNIKKLIKLSKANNIKTIISNHDFNKTPSKKEIISRIKKMIKFKCDIAKVAYMPKTKKDVITLLDASNEIKDFPIIAISMGELGIISRIFGSILTFASAKRSSAPGQLEAMKLKYILDSIYTKN